MTPAFEIKRAFEDVAEAEKRLGDLANRDDRAGQPIEDQNSATTVTAISRTWRFGFQLELENSADVSRRFS
jgi:hypothetical protein